MVVRQTFVLARPWTCKSDRNLEVDSYRHHAGSVRSRALHEHVNGLIDGSTRTSLLSSFTHSHIVLKLNINQLQLLLQASHETSFMADRLTLQAVEP